MIAIAGVIGAGLFIGSGAVIHTTGPGAIVSYALAGGLVILIMRMLGEMAVANPTSGSFAHYAHYRCRDVFFLYCGSYELYFSRQSIFISS
ncbi:hypothetical protein [Pseudalkalibacillus decolorationis]|uniref:hypothetical protein n=1 Tax=Pseudalkalibacillus decolorationis TaxID=163879 RepID=UPI003CD0C9A8